MPSATVTDIQVVEPNVIVTATVPSENLAYTVQIPTDQLRPLSNPERRALIIQKLQASRQAMLDEINKRQTDQAVIQSFIGTVVQL